MKHFTARLYINIPSRLREFEDHNHCHNRLMAAVCPQ